MIFMARPLSVFFFLFCACSVQAHLGDATNQLISRYGTPTARQTSTIGSYQVETLYFVINGDVIGCTVGNGVCRCVTFIAQDGALRLSWQDACALLDKNLGRYQFTNTIDGKAVSIWTYINDEIGSYSYADGLLTIGYKSFFEYSKDPASRTQGGRFNGW